MLTFKTPAFSIFKVFLHSLLKKNNEDTSSLSFSGTSHCLHLHQSLRRCHCWVLILLSLRLCRDDELIGGMQSDGGPEVVEAETDDATIVDVTRQFLY
ncbi:hypothetical protein NL676_022659 [Syzygium grande]|nr:hypothetical protein NL676_022659 [Syzygium grande]